MLVAQGDRDGAQRPTARHAIREALRPRDPANTEWQRDLSVSQDRIGDVLVAQGDRDGALKAYREGLAIREALTRRDPANTEWQGDLQSFRCMKIATHIDDQAAAPGMSRSCARNVARRARPERKAR